MEVNILNYFYPNIKQSILDIFEYGDRLLDNTSSFKLQEEVYLGNAILNKEYKLLSVNWIYNNGIDKIYNDEFNYAEFKNDSYSWYIGLITIITYWLERRGCFVIENNRYKNAAAFSILSDFEKHLNNPKPTGKSNQEMIDCIDTGHLYKFFINTLHALEESLLQEVNDVDFILSKNNDNNGIKLPISFVLDPLYLTITFIY